MDAKEVKAICASNLGDYDWSNTDRLLLRCVDALCGEARIDSADYSSFQQHWTREQQLEVFALCGNYHTISFVANSTGLENESFAPGFSG